MANKREKVVSGRASGASGTRPVGRTEGYKRVSDAGTGSSAGSWNREQNPNGSWNRDKNPKPVTHQSGSGPVKKNPKTTPATGPSGGLMPGNPDRRGPVNTAESLANRLSNIQNGSGSKAAAKSKYVHDTQEGRALPMNAAGSKKLKR